MEKTQFVVYERFHAESEEQRKAAIQQRLEQYIRDALSEDPSPKPET